MKESELRRGTAHTAVAAWLPTIVEIAGLLIVAIFLGHVMQKLHHANLSVLFLLIVLIIAARHGLWPSVVTSVLGFLAFNFFFTAPYRTFLVTEEGDIATLVFFLAIAILGGNLASRLRMAIQRRDQALERISNLYDFSHRIAGAASSREIRQTLVDHLGETLNAPVLIVPGGAGDAPHAQAASRAPHAPSAAELRSVPKLAAAPASELHGQGWSALAAPLAPDGPVRLMVHRTDLSDEQNDLIGNLCGQARVALDRIRLAEDLDSSRREAERARLRSALLTSVSHDLRTPLASIIGAASSLQELGDSLAAEDRGELLETVMGEARRLNGYIQNLLDMTRIEHGELQIHREWEEPSDLIGAAIRRAAETWPSLRVEVSIDPEVGLVHIHGELFVQALHNVIDNAVRYSPEGTRVELSCARIGDELRVEVTDAGPGLSAEQRERIFDMFYRAESGDSHRGGTGLGLAITRGILEAHGGRATAKPGPGGRGTRIVLRLPVSAPDVAGDAR